MYRIKVCALAALVAGGGASASILLADNPGNGCNPAPTCWDLHVCTALVECFTDPQIADPQECFDAILSIGYANCLSDVCPDSFVEATSPAPGDCLDQYLEFLRNCNDWSEYPADRLNCRWNPDILPSAEERKAMTEACGQAARLQYAICDHIANGGDPGNFDPEAGLITDGAASSGMFAPAEGVDSATWLRVPQVGDDHEVDAARLHALLWDGEDWAWSIVDTFAVADDGMISVDLSLNDVGTAAWIDALEVVIEWQNDGQTVTATPMRLDFANADAAADFNRDGTVTVADLGSFVDAYVAGAPRADFNNSGAVEPDDLSAFIAAFDAN